MHGNLHYPPRVYAFDLHLHGRKVINYMHLGVELTTAPYLTVNCEVCAFRGFIFNYGCTCFIQSRKPLFNPLFTAIYIKIRWNCHKICDTTRTTVKMSGPIMTISTHLYAMTYLFISSFRACTKQVLCNDISYSLYTNSAYNVNSLHGKSINLSIFKYA